MNNFKRPFFSKSIAEFWTRWHISLSSWFQDYVFNPLYFSVSKNKYLKKLSYKKKHIISFFITLVIGESLLGLWHGANWTFVLFGLYHGIFIFFFYMIRNQWKKLFSWLQVLITFIIVLLGFVFFRANSIQDAFYIFSHILMPAIRPINFVSYELGLSILFIGILFLVELLQENRKVNKIFNDYMLIRWGAYLTIFYCIILFGVFTLTSFIYFQF